MREFLHVQDIMNALEDKLLEGTRVKEVRVWVQPFEQISPSILKSLFYININDRGFPCIEIDVKPVGAQMQCMTCGRQFVSHVAECTCQFCGSSDCSFLSENRIAFELVESQEREFCA